jgi:hypothetical protein
MIQYIAYGLGFSLGKIATVVETSHPDRQFGHDEMGIVFGQDRDPCASLRSREPRWLAMRRAWSSTCPQS